MSRCASCGVDFRCKSMLILIHEEHEGPRKKKRKPRSLHYYHAEQKHLDFIERNKEVWERVQVYDMIVDK